MNATYNSKTNPLNQLLFVMLALPLGMIGLLIVSTLLIASLVLILTPIGMMLAPTWSVQLFQWKFESALNAWYLPVLGVLLDLGLVYIIKRFAQFSAQFASQLLNPSR
jgi:hypothetical protein